MSLTSSSTTAEPSPTGAPDAAGACLRVHGHHSLLTGVGSPAELLERGWELGLESVALCDVDSIAGVVELLQAHARLLGAWEDGRRAGAPPPRPIVGAELSDAQGRSGRVVALVREEAGWASLCKLVSARRLGADPGSVQPAELEGARFDLVDAVLETHAGLALLVDHPRLVLELGGRLPEGSLFAALPAPPPGLAARDRRTWTLFDPPEPTDPDTLDLIDAGKTPPPARPTAAVVLGLVAAAGSLGVPLVAAPDTYLARAADLPHHRVRAAIRGNALVERVPEDWLAREPAHLMGGAEQRALLLPYEDFVDEDADGLLARTAELARSCCFTPPLGGVVFPQLDLGTDKSPYSELTRLAFEGAAERYRPITPPVVERLEMELGAIDALGFAAYFLLVHKIAGFAKGRGIPCVGRGSAADSLVAYCLGLTDADPIRYRLPFERFLNPTRADRPDIDLDFCWRRRDEVLDAVYETFGATRTAMIATLGTFGLRSAFREAAVALGLAPAEFERWSRRLPWGVPARSAWREPPAKLAHLAQNPVAQAVANLPECRTFPYERFDATLDAAAGLLEVPRHMGLHPGGVVVAPRSITEHTACARAAKGPVVTQFDKDGVEAIGLVKMDLLGNRALTVVDDCVKLLATECGVDLDIQAIPEDDPETGELLATGRTVGCFQVESPGMRNLLKQTAARTMDDVIQAIALIRPGPASSGMKDAYVRRFRGREEPTPPHPLLAEVLADTYGVMLYQEDVMQVAVTLAGMTLAEADGLRRALSKRRSAELERLEARFLAGAAERGVTGDEARHVWELVANFATFGFCKAHAVTYGRISYRTAWLKAHFPVPFLASFLASHTGYYAQRVYVEEARRLGAAILGPDVNKSGADYAFARVPADPGGPAGSARPTRGAPVPGSEHPAGQAAGWPGIRAGLGQVKGLSETSITAILEGREAEGPFLSLPDLLERTCLARDEAEALIRTGALDAFDRTRPELLWRLHLLKSPARRAPRRIPGEASLDPVALESLRATPATRQAERLPGRVAEPASLFAGNTGWGDDGGRLPLTGKPGTGPSPTQPMLAFPPRELAAAALPALPDPDPRERALGELELLGFTCSLHPVALFGDKLPTPNGRAPELTPCGELDRLAGHRVHLFGWVAASRRLRGGDGRWMRFLTLEDESGLAEAAIFADAYERLAPRLSGPGPYLVSGTVEDQLGSCTLHVEDVHAE